MYTRARQTNGNMSFYDRDKSPSVSIWDNFPLLAIRSDPCVGVDFLDHFTGLVKAADAWVLNVATSGTAIAGTEPGGNLALNAGATTDGQGPQLQLAGLPFKPAANRDLGFEVRVKLNVLTADLFFGLAETNSALMTTSDLATANSIGVKSFTGNGVLLGQSEKATVEGTMPALATLVADTWVRVGFIVTGVTTVTFYVDGVQVGTSLPTENIPIVGLTPSFACHAIGTGTPQIDVDYVRAVQLLR